jgi:hypothetical protein
MWILKTSNSAVMSVYHTCHIKGRLITEKATVHKAVVIVNQSKHVHSKFFSTWLAIHFQRLHSLDILCIQFQMTMENFLHGCLVVWGIRNSLFP